MNTAYILEQRSTRNLAPVPVTGCWEKDRKEIVHLLEREEFGCLPRVKTTVTGKILQEDLHAGADRVIYRQVELTMQWESGSYTFPVHLVIPKQKVRGTFLHIAFPVRTPLYASPAEEIAENGFALVTVDYTSITSDDGNFADGLAGAWYQGRERGPEDPGKIMLWAWALSKVIDYLETVPEIEADQVAVVGHSRLGKTALCAGMIDERFALAISNDSGCGGAAVNCGNIGESIEAITRVFPYWFDAHYADYAGLDEEGGRLQDRMPFDQHYLLASLAPRRVYVASGELDSWADPLSEQISAQAAREVFEALGLPPDHVGSHVRPGGHGLTRADWLCYMDYMKKYITGEGN